LKATAVPGFAFSNAFPISVNASVSDDAAETVRSPPCADAVSPLPAFGPSSEHAAR
jgi:hypothetical protein